MATKVDKKGLKRKHTEKENEEPQENETTEPTTKTVKAVESSGSKTDFSLINKAIFGIFIKLQAVTEEIRKDHVNELISLLNNEPLEAKRVATCAYALKRLVRCTGADDFTTVALSSSHINRIVREVTNLDPLMLLETMKRELRVGGQTKGKEESLAAVGQLLTVLAIVQSQHFAEPAKSLIAMVYPILVSSLKGRDYLVGMCVDILVESFRSLSAKAFKNQVWPLLQPELSKPITELKLYHCDVLLAVHLHFDKVLPLQQLESQLWRSQPKYEQLFDLYLKSSTMLSEDVTARLGQFLGKQSNEKLLLAWAQQVMQQLPLGNNTIKGNVIHTMSYILAHFEDRVESLPFSQLGFNAKPLLGMLLQELAAAKQLMEQQSKENPKPSQLQLAHICQTFEKSLQLSFKHHLKHDATKVKVLQELLIVELQLDTVMQTPRITHELFSSLQAPSIAKMFDFYAQLVLNFEADNLKMHGEHCLKQMQQLLLHPQLTEGKAQLDLLQRISIFHVNDAGETCVPAEASPFSRRFAARCEEILFTCLLHKSGKSKSVEQLAELVQKLRVTLEALTTQLEDPKVESMLRAQQTPEQQQAWLQVNKLLKSKQKNKELLSLAFDALIFFMGLTLFTPNCSTPVELLDDILVCKQNALKAGQKKAKGKQQKTEPEELPWQDVLTDLLLNLLVQKGHFWREVVNVVGSALMPSLSKQNFEQLLVVLDMNKNPLAEKQSEDSDDDEEEQEQDEEQSSDEDEDNDEDEEEDEEEDEDQEDDDEATQLELIRENVRKALLEANEDDAQDDNSSVDWNDVDEWEGERLHAALERAFRGLRPKGSQRAKNNGKGKDKQSKSERIDATTLLHFRVRVLDLVELFVQAQPQMEVLLDALTSVFYVIQHCSHDQKLEPLGNASKKLLRKLLSQKISYEPKDSMQPVVTCIEHFISLEQPQQEDDDEEEEENKKKKKQVPHPQQSIKRNREVAECRNKCVAYLVSQFTQKDSLVWPLLQSYLQDWITHRNSPHSLASFDAILQSQWTGIPQLSLSLAQLLVGDLRKFRRMQILELLSKHSGRIAVLLVNHPAEAQQLLQLLNAYKHVGPKDQKLCAKLLTKLNKHNKSK